MVRAKHVVKGQGDIIGSATNGFTSFSFLKIWPWKSKVKVMAKVKADSYIWGLVFNRKVLF